jgi:hypothetical protein
MSRTTKVLRVLSDLLSVAAIILAAILLYRFHPAILRALKRFDTANRARIEGEIRDRGDSLAHFRHTLRLAEEQFEAVSAIAAADERTGTPVTRYLFEGEVFANERDAVRAREDKVRAKAREFYRDLPSALAARKGDGKLGRD